MGDLFHNITYPPDIKFGILQVDRIYCGTEWVWPRTTTTTTTTLPTTTTTTTIYTYNCINNELVLTTTISTEFGDWNTIDINKAQTITLNGIINQIQIIEGHRGGLPDYDLEIRVYDGIVTGSTYPPINTLLGLSDTVKITNTEYGPLSFNFSTPVTVNGVASLVFYLKNILTHNDTNRYFIHGTSTGTYSSGQTYYQYGGSWTSYGNADLALKICYNYITTTTTTAATTTTTTTTATTTTTTTTTAVTTTTTTTVGVCDYTMLVGTDTMFNSGSTIGLSGDDVVKTLTLPFTFQFYSNTYTTINVCSNGFANFGITYNAWTNNPLPSGVQNAMFPFWDDLNISTGFGIFSGTTGAAPNRIYYIRWYATRTGLSTNENFELRLYETSNRIQFVYGANTGGVSSTIGIQKLTGTLYTQYSYNTSSVVNGTSITFYNNCFEVAPTAAPTTTTTTAAPTTTTTTAAPTTTTTTAAPTTTTTTAAPTTTTTTTICIILNIGDSYGGGVVGYISPDYSYVIVASSSDIGTTQQFCFNDSIINPYVPILGISYDGLYYNLSMNGYDNSNLIVSALDGEGQSGYAAKLARNYTVGGYTDWYLPTVNELEALMINLPSIGWHDGATINDCYWTSSSGSWDEYNNQYRIFRLLYNGGSVSFNGYSPDITGFKYGYLKPVRRIQVCITPPITTTTTTTTLPTTTTTTTTLPSLFSLTTNSTSSAWTAYITKSGADLHWEITGANTFSYDGNSPTFDFSASSGNNYITVTSIDGSSGLTNLELTSLNITELNVSGAIELTYLDCNGNQLTSLNVSTNTALTYIDLSYNQLINLDISNNLLLDSLRCSNNLITSLDVSGNTILTYLDCGSNQLTMIDISNNLVLTSLSCYNNLITSLDVSGNTSLIELYCSNNLLPILVLPNSIQYLDCSYNQLVSLDFSNISGLIYLICVSNQLTSLNISGETLLNYLDCNSNQIDKTIVDTILNDLIIYNISFGYFDLSNQIPPAYANMTLVTTLRSVPLFNTVIVDEIPVIPTTTSTTTTTVCLRPAGLINVDLFSDLTYSPNPGPYTWIIFTTGYTLSEICQFYSDMFINHTASGYHSATGKVLSLNVGEIVYDYSGGCTDYFYGGYGNGNYLTNDGKIITITNEFITSIYTC